MKVGLFFGTFNPIHNGHLFISERILNNTDIDEIWLVISPKSPHKIYQNILDKNLRYNLVSQVLKEYKKIKVSNIEFDMEEPNYTYKTLFKLTSLFPKNNFIIIMGEDNYASIDNWKENRYIKKYEIR